jgi:hypothetical protein
MITPERLHDLLRFDPETGRFEWKVPRRGVKRGSQPGTLRPDGYLQINLDGRVYKTHRLAWLAHYGEWPSGFIDHINGDPTDNRIANLRSVSPAGNAQNQKLRCTNTSGEQGITWFARDNKWWVKLTKERRVIHIGYFDDMRDAVIARDAAYKAAGFHKNHGRR